MDDSSASLLSIFLVASGASGNFVRDHDMLLVFFRFFLFCSELLIVSERLQNESE